MRRQEQADAEQRRVVVQTGEKAEKGWRKEEEEEEEKEKKELRLSEKMGEDQMGAQRDIWWG